MKSGAVFSAAIKHHFHGILWIVIFNSVSFSLKFCLFNQIASQTGKKIAKIFFPMLISAFKNYLHLFN